MELAHAQYDENHEGEDAGFGIFGDFAKKSNEDKTSGEVKGESDSRASGEYSNSIRVTSLYSSSDFTENHDDSSS